MSKPRALALNRLTLTDFRNYAHLRLDVGAGLVVLTGPNGAGKTNLLEALSLLCPGRGLRSATYPELSRHGGEGGQWAIAARLDGPEAELRIGTAWQGERPGFSEGRGQGRQVKIDGREQRGSGALGNAVRMAWITPAMDRLFMGPASDRRRFLDRLVIGIDPEHASRVQAFEKLMRDRNRLLEQRQVDGVWLDSIETSMAEHAVAIAASRRSLVDTLTAVAQDPAGRASMGAFPWGRFAIDGALESEITEEPAVNVEERYRRLLNDSRRVDAGAGRTLNGPHRSDLMVRHGPKDVDARLCSTGEQKALLIGIVLAHARIIAAGFGGYAPILLLDEVAAHLDEARRQGLFDCLTTLGVQAWMTGTDAALFEPLRGSAQFFEVREGALLELVD
ncbi:DNA replication and repair protein RecF [Rhodoligotrophos appendicifer]|uniref:DNA replication/repair protein RecF n=1 Tax=Rhodoligotrophos appendicifer TaxID=987056 RepID=UPI001FE444E3|nr:DNA replication/repair protein RecF [Rhodoligotrophos appendicifer]